VTYSQNPLEPGSQGSVEIRILYSIAVSLKRIADEVCGVPYDPAPGADNSRYRMGITDGIMHAIEQGLLAASHRR
jgi:hypothetical protein